MYKLSEELKTTLNNRKFRALIKKSKVLLKEVTMKVLWTDDIDEQIYAVKNNIMERPKCPICQTELKLKESKGSFSYNKGCNPNHAREVVVIEKYGVKNVFQLDHVKEKSKQTSIKKYGTKFPTQNKEQLEKAKQTCLERYGVDNYFKTDEFQVKRKNTCLDKFGVEHQMKSEEIKSKLKETYLERFGVDNPSKNKEIFEKIMDNQNMYAKKEFIFPSGKKVLLMGYEPIVVERLLEIYDETEIFVEIDKIPTFDYIFEGKERVYYPDIFIPKDNLIIEVKSTYTFHKDYYKNLAKEQAVLTSGFDFKFEIVIL